MKEDVPNWSDRCVTVGALGGGTIGYAICQSIIEQPDATAAEASGQAVAAVIIGTVFGTPAGALLGFGLGKLLKFLKIKH